MQMRPYLRKQSDLEHRADIAGYREDRTLRLVLQLCHQRRAHWLIGLNMIKNLLKIYTMYNGNEVIY